MKRFVFALSLLTLLPVLFPDKVAAHKLRVLSFNIRYENREDSGLNAWSHRREGVCRFIRHERPDLFGLQEVLHGPFTYLADNLTDYAFVGVGREDGREKGEASPVCYRKSRFLLLRSGWFWLSPTPERPSKGWDAACERIVTWVVLRDKKSGLTLAYANTHFDHVGVEAPRRSALLIKERLAQLIGGQTAILSGDFNMTDDDCAYPALTSYKFPMADAWKTAEKRTGEPITFTDFGRIRSGNEKIDFIFVTPSFRVKRAAIVNSLQRDSSYLSDHNAHVVDLRF